MDCLLRIFYFVRRYVRMASLVLTGAFLLFFAPLSGIGFEPNNQCDVSRQMTNILNPENINNPQSILDEIGKLEGTFISSEEPLEEARRFFVSFVNEINFKYGMKLTIEDAFHIARENIHNMQVSEEEKTSMLALMQLLEFGSIVEEQTDAHLNIAGAISWHWKWLGSHKKKDVHKKMGLSINQQESVDLPSNVYIGAIELLVAPLIFILPFPGAQVFAGAVAADGLRRIADGVEQLGEERRNNPNYISPQPPFNN